MARSLPEGPKPFINTSKGWKGMRKEVIGNATLYLGDCMEVLPTLKVDAVVTDPPYGLDMAKKGTIGTSKNAKVKDYGADDWDSLPASPEQVEAIRACSRYQVIFGGNYFDLPPTSCWLVWDKLNTGDFADCELAWTNLDKAVRRIQWRWNGMIRQGNEARFHPTQKPLEVMRWCVGHLPKDAKTICDPFMGSGTTGVACVKAGKSFVGVEREEKYFNVACERIAEAYLQPDMLVAIDQPEPETLDMLA
jgi:DNA modification methylase